MILILDNVDFASLAIQVAPGTDMNARESGNFLPISRSFSASNGVEIFWAELYQGRLILGLRYIGARAFMSVPVSIDGKTILTLYYSTLQKVHKSKKNFYFNHPKDLHDFNIDFRFYVLVNKRNDTKTFLKYIFMFKPKHYGCFESCQFRPHSVIFVS
jgi:hypothetical protein